MACNEKRNIYDFDSLMMDQNVFCKCVTIKYVDIVEFT